MADVFLSYARQDTAQAKLIKDRLEGLGLEVFFDTEGLDGGDVFPDVLDHEVKSAGAVVGVWSRHALTRPWVKIECDIGRERGVLVPIQIEDIPALDRPAAFWNIQFADLSDFDGDNEHVGWLSFIRALARTLDRDDLLAREVATHTAATDTGDEDVRAELSALREELAAMRAAKSAGVQKTVQTPTQSVAKTVSKSSAPSIGAQKKGGLSTPLLILGGIIAAGFIMIIGVMGYDGGYDPYDDDTEWAETTVEKYPGEMSGAINPSQSNIEAYSNAMSAGTVAAYRGYLSNPANTTDREFFRESLDEHEDAIMELQVALANKGFDPSGADGKVGPGTINALNRFKQSYLGAPSANLNKIEADPIYELAEFVERVGSAVEPQTPAMDTRSAFVNSCMSDGTSMTVCSCYYSNMQMNISEPLLTNFINVGVASSGDPYQLEAWFGSLPAYQLNELTFGVAAATAQCGYNYYNFE